jgi:hypothetical protein
MAGRTRTEIENEFVEKEVITEHSWAQLEHLRYYVSKRLGMHISFDTLINELMTHTSIESIIECMTEDSGD